MAEHLHITKIGKLRIYMGSGEALQPGSLLRRMFPRSKYLEILRQAKASGIRDAHGPKGRPRDARLP